VEKRRIPNTDILVSPLCLGTMTFGTPLAEPDAISLTQWALDHEINFIDTANMYEGYTRFVGSPGGVAEQILGKALLGRRDQVILATKVGMKIGPSDDDEGLGAAHIRREIDRSLRRLECDAVDIYYMHKPDPKTPLGESIQAFDDLITAGKIRYWGFSNFTSDLITELLRLCDENGWRRPVVSQPPYSLLKRDIETDVLPLCQREHIATVPYQVLQGGLLTGKYRRHEAVPSGSRKEEKPGWVWDLSDDLFARIEQLEAEAGDAGRSLLRHALRALLDQPGIVSVIIGAKRPDQLATLIDAVA
jgi:aryl-alcohol dehydrogenase-like predicted oxidoreductase